ncbi:Chromosome partition protein Smc [bacterium HR29]|jgi:chromosome segregation ATPase|nr:Chromosome partition protein Smc [bacterium HR29]
MPGEGTVQGLAEMLSWLEGQVRDARDAHEALAVQVEHLRRQLANADEELEALRQAFRGLEPRLAPLRGVPEKLEEMEREGEELRQEIVAARQDFEHTVRLLRAEAEYDRQERGELFRRVNDALARLERFGADVAQAQNQVAQFGQLMQTLLERQRVVEDRLEQFGLRLDRVMEVARDYETRLRDAILGEVEERLRIVFEQLRIVGEMAKRAEDVASALQARPERQEEILDELATWREEHRRVEARLAALEELGDRVLGDLDKLRADFTLLEGRHQGLGERVAGMRRDIAEIVDHVRAEFQKYNQLVEKQRRLQISMLEQELRELKFHALRPPEEP